MHLTKSLPGIFVLARTGLASIRVLPNLVISLQTQKSTGKKMHCVNPIPDNQVCYCE